MEAPRKYEERDHAKLYSKYRPVYPEHVHDIIVDFCGKLDKEDDRFNLAVDVGCGNGQSTFPLCKYFNHVIGYDVSGQQIAHASKDNLNLTFKVGAAENLGFLADSSVDLITCFQSLHWFNLNAFFKEVNRVLKHGGVFAAYGYGISKLDDAAAEAEYKQFYRDIVLPYLDVQSHHCNLQHYRCIGFPFEHYERIEDTDMDIHLECCVDDFIGYIVSTAGWRNYKTANPETDVLEELQEKLKGIYRGRQLHITWPGFMLIGRKPCQNMLNQAHQ